MRTTVQELRKALKRAVYNHGHDLHCSAARGMERDCHCGWLEVKTLAGPKPVKEEPKFEYVPGYYRRIK